MTRKILLFGAGFVSTTVIEYLTRRPENHLTIVSRTESVARDKMAKYAHDGRASVVQLDVEQDDADTTRRLAELISQHHVVISLVPYTYHVKLARICIDSRGKAGSTLPEAMVTTSYISDAMRALDAEAQQVGLIIMNEIGVDPGTDHLSAVKIIEETRRAGGKVLSFTSFCGGLPAPEVLAMPANRLNPLKYKFSWSPAGVLRALTNNAKFLQDGRVVDIPSERLLVDGRRGMSIAGLEFEGYPNRNSVPYQELYNIPDAQTVLRGTLRYAGFCDTILQFKQLGVFDFAPRTIPAGLTWRALLKQLLNVQDDGALEAAVVERLGLQAGGAEAQQVLEQYRWLGLLSEKALAQTPSYSESLALLLKENMEYNEGERDMTLLQHNFVVENRDGSRTRHLSTLEIYADDKFSSMAKGTGLPCAVATQMILDGRLTRKGVWGPFFYEEDLEMLAELEKVGLKFVEESQQL